MLKLEEISICCVGDGGLESFRYSQFQLFEGWKLMKDIKTGDKVFDEKWKYM